MDIKQHSRLLLEKLANSIYDRMAKDDKPFFFSEHEVRIVEVFLDDYENKVLCREDLNTKPRC